MKSYLHFEQTPSFTYILKNIDDTLTIAQVKSVSKGDAADSPSTGVLIMFRLAICDSVQCQIRLSKDAY